jgi:hypothetical protein
MNGLALILLGVWIIAQATAGDAITRLGITGDL